MTSLSFSTNRTRECRICGIEITPTDDPFSITEMGEDLALVHVRCLRKK